MDGHYYQPPETSQEPQMHLTDKSCQNVRVLDQTWSSYQSGNKWIVHHPHKILHFSDTFTLISIEMNTGRHTYLMETEIRSGTQIMHFSPCRMSWPHTDHENSSPVKTINILRLFLFIHECSASSAWMGDVSVHYRENRILSLYRWNNVIVNEWGFCFPPKELQAVSYFVLRDPFIFQLFLLLTLIPSADISAAHVIRWNFLKTLVL